MKRTMTETDRRRKKQMEYNELHGIVPTTAGRKKPILSPESNNLRKAGRPYSEETELSIAADPVIKYMSQEDLRKQSGRLKSAMVRAAKDLDFMEAARLRDEILAMERLIQSDSQV